MSPVYSVAFSPDGKQLASGDAPGKVLIWDIATLRPSLTLNVSDKAIVRIAFSHDGRALATGDELGRVKVWDLRTRDIVWRHEGRNVAGVIGAFYYLRIIKVMYFDEPADSFDGPIGGEMKAVIAVSSLIIILFFLYPAPVLTNAAAAAAALFSG